MRFTASVLIFAAQVFAQSFPEAAPLLNRQTQELERYHSYEYTQETTITINMPGMVMPGTSMTTQVQAINPGKRRQSTKMAGMDASLMISNGDDTWLYQPLAKQYTRISGSDTAGQRLAGATDLSGVADLKQMSDSAKVTGSEFLTVDGEQRDCWVIESKVDKLEIPGQGGGIQDAVFTTWVDKNSGMQWKMSMSGKVQVGPATPAMSTASVTLIHSLKINPDLDDSLFVFTPPAGSTENDNPFPGLPGAAAPKARAAATDPVKQPAKRSAPGEPEAFVAGLTPSHQIDPVYPPEAEAQKIQGFVHVLITIDPTGAVSNAEAMTGKEILRSAAIDAVKQWTFRPILRNGRAVFAYTDAELSFPPDRDFSPPDEKSDPLKGGADFDPATFFNSDEAAKFGFNMQDELKASQRITDLQAKFPRSPEQILSDTQDQQRGASGVDRLNALPKLAQQALDAGDLTQASSYANELLQMTAQFKVPGTSIYDANSVLGLVALRQGSITQARQYLLDAGKSPAPPFEALPDFTLAHELLDKGEREAVLEFLVECKGYWESGGSQLDQMIADVRAGKSF